MSQNGITLHKLDGLIKQRSQSQSGFDFFSEAFTRKVALIGHTLLVLTPWEDAVPLKRVWCIFEIYVTVMTGSRLQIVVPPEEQDEFIAACSSDFS